MTSFIEALQGFDFTTASAAQNAQISVGNGNNTITVIGDNSNIKAGNGNNEIETLGDDDSILVGDGSNKITTAGTNTTIVAGDIHKASSQGNNDIYQVGDNAKIAVGNGDNTIISYSTNATIVGGNGDNVVGSMGNNVKIGMGNGDNAIGFWGNNDVIVVGNGNNTIKSLDWLNGGPTATDTSSKNYYDSTIKGIVNASDMSKLKANSDIMAMAANAKSSYNVKTTHDRQVTGTTVLGRSSQTIGNRLYTYTTTATNYLDTYITNLKVSGLSNTTIKIGSGNNDIGLTATANKYSITGGGGSNRLSVITDATLDRRQETSQSAPHTTITSQIIRWSYDPLVIDFNQDGKVSAAAGQGIDLNGDGVADGAATNGDKMLAMSDINGNGEIDGAEIFGDTTVDPFTKQRLNAKNGFQALELLAKSAEQHTTVKNIIDTDGNVDLAKLKEALATVGINLGFVSDANNSKIEELSKVAKINVKNYSESGETEGTVHHAQQGTYVDENGKEYKVHDVWFHQL